MDILHSSISNIIFIARFRCLFSDSMGDEMKGKKRSCCCAISNRGTADGLPQHMT